MFESFGVISFLITYHHPFVSHSFRPTHHAFHPIRYTSLPVRHSKRTDIRRSRINISLAAIMQPRFCSLLQNPYSNMVAREILIRDGVISVRVMSDVAEVT